MFDPLKVELTTLSSGQLEREIARLAAEISAATCRWLLLAAEFERRGAHEAWGFACCAQWLAWRCSIVPRSAREHLRVARDLAEFPAVRRAFGRGELSYSKVRAITRAAGPELEEELLELSRHSTAAQLERIVRGYRRAVSLESARESIERRHLGCSWEEDGSLTIRGRLTAEEGALFMQAIEAGRERRVAAAGKGGSAGPQPAQIEGEGEGVAARSPNASSADALVTMAETLLASGPRTRPAGDRHQVVVHVDERALATAAGTAAEDFRCAIEDGPPLSAATARRLACDASIVPVVESSNGRSRTGRKHRAIPASTRRALRLRDHGCRFPGCENRRWIDAHHIEHWADGGDHSLGNLIQLCGHHHRLLHEGGFTLTRGSEGKLAFRRPDGKLLIEAPPLSRASEATRETVPFPPPPRVPTAPAEPAVGLPMDLHLTVSGLLARASPPAG